MSAMRFDGMGNLDCNFIKTENITGLLLLILGRGGKGLGEERAGEEGLTS